MYGRWFLTTFFWIAIALVVVAAAFLASPLLALVFAAIAGGVALLFAGAKRAGENRTSERATPRTRARAHGGRGGAPASGEGGS